MTLEYLKFNRLLAVPPLPPFLSWSYLRLAFLLFVCTEKDLYLSPRLLYSSHNHVVSVLVCLDTV